MANKIFNENFYWRLGLGISLLVHLLFFFLSTYSFSFSKAISINKTVCSKILDLCLEKKSQFLDKNIPKYTKKLIKEFNSESITDPTPPPFIDNAFKKITRNNNKINFKKNISEKIMPIKDIFLNDFLTDQEIKKSPAYMNYYNNIRQKIKEKAFQYYENNFEGDISLNFTIYDDGSIKRIEISKDSTGNKNLQEIALRSINEAAPFGEFPISLKNYTNRQFTVTICFKKK